MDEICIIIIVIIIIVVITTGMFFPQIFFIQILFQNQWIPVVCFAIVGTIQGKTNVCTSDVTHQEIITVI